MTEIDERAQAEHMERSLATALSWGLPAATVLASIGVGLVFGVGPAILVLAAGALVGVIGLLWASLRTLGGDAPLAEGLATAAATRVGVSQVTERKRRVLRALKDLELEHSVGKIDDEDFAEMRARYREQAKEIFREMDVEIEPLRPKAEALVRAHLEKKGLLADKPAPGAEPSRDGKRAIRDTAEASGRVACPACGTGNEPDAAFCKKCRARVSRVACSGCATSNEPDATFCKKCGASLSDEGKDDGAVGANGE
jgi:hypothetical protein